MTHIWRGLLSGSQCCCCRPLTYLPAKDGRIMLLFVWAYMCMLSYVHFSCNERIAVIAHLSLFVIGRFDGFRFYEPYHLVAKPFQAAAGGRHFIVCAADFVADSFLCWFPFFRQIAAVLDFQFPFHFFPSFSYLLSDKFRSKHRKRVLISVKLPVRTMACQTDFACWEVSQTLLKTLLLPTTLYRAFLTKN